MNMLRSKVKKKLPALNFLSKVNNRNLTELFKPVKTLNFEDDDEWGKDSCIGKWKGKHSERFCKIYIENKKIVRKFTTEYKKTLREVKNETPSLSGKKTRPILSETLDDIKKVIENSRKKLNDQDYHIHIKDPIEVDDYIQESDIDYEEDSTTWILLRAKCDKETSETSSEEFNEVQFKDEDDLSRPSVDWQIWNDSVLKCQNWLNTLEMNE